MANHFTRKTMMKKPDGECCRMKVDDYSIQQEIITCRLEIAVVSNIGDYLEIDKSCGT